MQPLSESIDVKTTNTDELSRAFAAFGKSTRKALVDKTTVVAKKILEEFLDFYLAKSQKEYLEIKILPRYRIFFQLDDTAQKFVCIWIPFLYQATTLLHGVFEETFDFFCKKTGDPECFEKFFFAHASEHAADVIDDLENVQEGWVALIVKHCPYQDQLQPSTSLETKVPTKAGNHLS